MIRRLSRAGAVITVALGGDRRRADAAIADSIPATVVQALIHQARFWRARGRADVAQQALHRAREADPDNLDVKRELAWVPPAEQAARARAAGFQALEAGRLDEAEVRFSAALKLSPQRPGHPRRTGRVGCAPAGSTRPADCWPRLPRPIPPNGPPPSASARFYGDLRKATAAATPETSTRPARSPLASPPPTGRTAPWRRACSPMSAVGRPR